jgi:hypothetical protein
MQNNPSIRKIWLAIFNKSKTWSLKLSPVFKATARIKNKINRGNFVVSA